MFLVSSSTLEQVCRQSESVLRKCTTSMWVTLLSEVGMVVFFLCLWATLISVVLPPGTREGSWYRFLATLRASLLALRRRMVQALGFLPFSVMVGSGLRAAIL